VQLRGKRKRSTKEEKKRDQEREEIWKYVLDNNSVMGLIK